MAGLAAVDELPENITVVVTEDDDSVRTSPDGTVEIDRPDGGVVIKFNTPANDDEDGDKVDPAKFYQNLATKIDESKRNLIADDLINAVEADDRSRSQWLTDRQRGMDLLGLKLKEPQSAAAGDSSTVLEGLSTVTNPLLLTDCIKGWANAQAELLPASGPCKVEDVGEEESEETTQLADAFERGMNSYLTDVAKEYYPDTNKMLLWGTIFSGSGFKKVYYCPLRRRPVSDTVDPQNLIVSDTTSDLRAAERVTHKIPMRRSVLKRMQLAGAYLKDVELTSAPSPVVTPVDEKIAAIQGTRSLPERPEDQPYTIYEVQCELDLDQFAPGKFKGTGIALPFLVTIEKDSRAILAIRRDWKPEDEECERRQQFTRYPYVPGPGFYGTGLLNILGNSSAALTAAWREALDAGMMANFPGFLVSKGATRQNTSDLRVGVGQGTPIDTQNKPIGDVVAQLPYHDVTPGLMTLIDKITSQSKEAGGAPEVPVGEGTANIPVGTMLALIEQTTKVMSAAHKGMHTAQSEELQMLADLFREHPEAFWRTNKKIKRDKWDEQKLMLALTNCNLVPKSDPNVPSHIHRVMKAVALIQVVQLPAFAPQTNMKEAYLRILRAMREDPDGLVIEPAPKDATPDPNAIKAQAALISAQAKAQELPVKAAKIANDQRAADARERIEGQKLQGQTAVKTVDLAKELVEQHGETQRSNREHGMNMTKLALETGQQAMDMQQKSEGGAVERHKLGLAFQQHNDNHGLAMRQQDHAERQHADQHALATKDQQDTVGLGLLQAAKPEPEKKK